MFNPQLCNCRVFENNRKFTQCPNKTSENEMFCSKHLQPYPINYYCEDCSTSKKSKSHNYLWEHTGKYDSFNFPSFLKKREKLYCIEHYKREILPSIQEFVPFKAKDGNAIKIFLRAKNGKIYTTEGVHIGTIKT